MTFINDPWSWWVEPFLTNPFMRNALWAGLLTVITNCIVGVWVVLKGLSFLGDALAHGILPGIAIAYIMGFNLTLGAFIAGVTMVLGVTAIRSVSPLPEDTSIGILFVGFLAAAVVIISSQRSAYAGDLNRFLFGSVTAVDTASLHRQMIAAACVVVVSLVFYRAFLVMTFDQVQARMLGLHPRLALLGLLVLLTVAIISSFETIGSLLVVAYLIAPPAGALLVVRRVPMAMVTAVGVGAFSALVGILLSYHHNSAAGATMALCAVGSFFCLLAVYLMRRFLRRFRTRRVATQILTHPA